MNYTRKRIPKRLVLTRKGRSSSSINLVKKQTATIETQTDFDTDLPAKTLNWPIRIDQQQERTQFPDHIPKRVNTHVPNNITKIPLVIYQTWNSTLIPKEMANNIVRLLTINPEFDYYLYDDNKSREFILKHFGEEVVNAYDTLIPGAFKADLWRYCVLYIYGGFYLDIKYHSVVPFISLLEYGPTIFVKERITDISPKDEIHNAFIVSTPKNEVFKYCINDIVFSCRFKLYNHGVLGITGPGLLGRMMMKYYPDLYSSYLKDFKFTGNRIMKGSETILEQYPEYVHDQRRFEVTKHYGVLYYGRQIYKDFPEIRKGISHDIRRDMSQIGLAIRA